MLFSGISTAYLILFTTYLQRLKYYPEFNIVACENKHMEDLFSDSYKHIGSPDHYWGTF